MEFFFFFFFWPLSFYCETDVLISYQDYNALCKLITCLGTLNPNSFLELESSASHTLGVGGTKRKLEIVFTRVTVHTTSQRPFWSEIFSWGLNSIFMHIPPFAILCKYGFWSHEQTHFI